MSVDDGEGFGEVDGEVGVVSQRMEVECRDLKCLKMDIDQLEDGGIDGCSDEDEGIGCKDLVLDCPGLQWLYRYISMLFLICPLRIYRLPL